MRFGRLAPSVGVAVLLVAEPAQGQAPWEFWKGRLDGEEQVILEETGPGAITRIWMTAGWGISEPLDPSVRIRIRVDGAEAPVVDVPLPDFFSGNVAPFLAPLVASRELSSGGNVSYVPIPYRTGCRVSLVHALSYRL